MMTPEQVKELATLATNVGHIMTAIDKINDRLDKLPTHSDLKSYVTTAEVDALRREISSLREEIADLRAESPASLWTRFVKIAVGVGALGGAFAVLKQYVQVTWKA